MEQRCETSVNKGNLAVFLVPASATREARPRRVSFVFTMVENFTRSRC